MMNYQLDISNNISGNLVIFVKILLMATFIMTVLLLIIICCKKNVKKSYSKKVAKRIYPCIKTVETGEVDWNEGSIVEGNEESRMQKYREYDRNGETEDNELGITEEAQNKSSKTSTQTPKPVKQVKQSTQIDMKTVVPTEREPALSMPTENNTITKQSKFESKTSKIYFVPTVRTTSIAKGPLNGTMHVSKIQSDRLIHVPKVSPEKTKPILEDTPKHTENIKAVAQSRSFFLGPTPSKESQFMQSVVKQPKIQDKSNTKAKDIPNTNSKITKPSKTFTSRVSSCG